MRLQRRDRFSELEPFLDTVEHPARYINHEFGAMRPSEGQGAQDVLRCVLMYPDTYEIGLSNMGLSILYRVVNETPGLSAERAYVPWIDMSAHMRAAGVPLLALESAAPVASFDVVGFTLAHEMACTNIIEALDLAQIPVRAADRAEDDTLVIAGGPSVWNSEPVAAMFDAILLGDGEEALPEMLLLIKKLRAQGSSRHDILLALAQVKGVYVPSLYDIVHDKNSTVWGYAKPKAHTSAPERVVKRVISDLSATNPLPSEIVPYMQTVFDRLSIEILRGCARGCRFCQAGMTYRPVRERPAEQVVKATCDGLAQTGYDEVSLTSLSTTDHSQCRTMLHEINQNLHGTGTRVSIPSQRLDSFGIEMALEVGGGKRGGLTFAPEAGSQRLRDVINKNVTDADLDLAAKNAFENGWRRMKLYFMMGLPTETDEDIVAIPQTAERALAVARSLKPGKKCGATVSVSVSVFVPKAHTPFQWAGQLPLSEVRRRQELLLHSAPDRAVRISYHNAQTSQIEAVLSRSGRAAFELIYRAWELGCRFDAWTDQFNYDLWVQAATELGYDLEKIASTPYELDQILPWEHTSPGVSKGYLQREWRRAVAGVPTPDCTFESCTGCGVCPSLGVDNLLWGERG